LTVFLRRDSRDLETGVRRKSTVPFRSHALIANFRWRHRSYKEEIFAVKSSSA
jgi:hypothetical protein